jgi:2-amino-4-hydroxy-6-hydroxymethyldihydropteridine diphosphokinase
MSDARVASPSGASNPSRLFVIGLGANLGDRLATLRSALRAIGGLGSLEGVSALYETQAVGPPQPDYLNGAALLSAGLAPNQLLDALLAIERAHGRERRERWGPRTLDLDLLHSPGLVLDDPALTLPHAELHRRPFALVPLLEVLPDACDARSGASYSELLASLDRSSLRRLETASRWP